MTALPPELLALAQRAKRSQWEGADAHWLPASHLLAIELQCSFARLSPAHMILARLLASGWTYAGQSADDKAYRFERPGPAGDDDDMRRGMKAALAAVKGTQAMTRDLEWVTNAAADPMDYGPLTPGQSRADFLRWRQQFTEGDPSATFPDCKFTVEQLKAMGMVGLYRRREEPPQ